MHARAESFSALEKNAELLLLPVFQDETNAAKKIDWLLDNAITGLSKKEFLGKPGQTVLLHGRKSIKRCLLHGLGKRSEYNNELLRQAGGRLAAAAQNTGVENVAFALPEKTDAYEATVAIVEGIALGAYKFDKYFTDEENKSKPVKEVIAVSGDVSKAKNALDYAVIVSECANAGRNLSNESGAEGTPAAIAGKMAALAKENKIGCKILSVEDARKKGMGAFLSVAAGSEQPAKFVVLEYKPSGTRGKPIALVGKGITFDSGGISIKPSQNMEKMKHDKSGAAAVTGALVACAKLKLPLHVVGVCPLTENLPSGRATKPGDVVRAMSGKTIEVVNTDAEGRLVLADALAYAVKEFKPQAVIDLATLTGACVVALGDVYSGLFCDDEKLRNKIVKAGAAEGEKCWRLPMDKEYDEKIKSSCADIKNVGALGEAGATAGASFLKNFVGETPWAHLDIAGTAWTEKEKPYYAIGATGFGVRLLARMLHEWK